MSKDTLQMIASLAWPILTLIILALFYPTLRRILNSREFTIELGKIKISVPQSLESLNAQIADLREQVMALKQAAPVAKAAAAPGGGVAAPGAPVGGAP